MGATAADVRCCTPRTRRCSDARSYNAILRRCCREHVIRLSHIAAEAFTDAKIPFWADYGTLMGAVCNPLTTRKDYPWLPQGNLPEGPLPPGIIPHDKDADWGLFIEDWRAAFKALHTRMKRDSLRLKRERLNLVVRQNSGSMKFRLSLFNHTNLDLFFWNTVPEGKTVKLTQFGQAIELGPGMMYRVKYAQVDRFKGREFRRRDLLPLTTVQWEDMTLPAPRDPEAWLEFRYGPDWRTPVAANNKGVKR